MTQNKLWKVVYSATREKYFVTPIGKAFEESLPDSLNEILHEDQCLGLFTDKDTAYILYERLLYKHSVRGTPSEDIPFLPISKATDQTLSFDLVLSLICEEFRKKPGSFMEAFCGQYSLPVQKISYLVKNPEYSQEAALLVSRILIALNYLVKMTEVTVFEGKDFENAREEVTYYFTQKKGKDKLPIAINPSTH